MAWTNIAKPTTTAYTNVAKPVGILNIPRGYATGIIGPPTYSQAIVITGWVKVNKPSSSAWINVSKPT